MTIMLKACVLYPIALLCVLSKAGAQQQFPEWRGSTLLLPAVWAASPIIAVGEVTNVASYGEQSVDRLPSPMARSVHKLYWCEGDFKLTAVVKGELDPKPKRYLWASAVPGCKLWPDNPRLIFSRFETRAWFLREEGGLLRPTFDGGTQIFLGLFAKWEGPRLPARQRLGLLLLDPAANSDTLEDFASYLWDVGDIACELLGKAECVRRIRALTDLGSPKLREAGCDFLKGQLGTDCIPRWE